MTRYQKGRVRIWMVQVRKEGTKEFWSVTGKDWFHLRADAEDYIAGINWPQYEYRTVAYMPTEE